MSDKIKLKDKIGTCFVIILSSIFLSFIPFALLISYYGFYNIFYFVLIMGLIVGVLWSIKVIKRGNYYDYDPMILHQTPDIIESWEKEKNKKQFDNPNNE